MGSGSKTSNPQLRTGRPINHKSSSSIFTFINYIQLFFQSKYIFCGRSPQHNLVSFELHVPLQHWPLPLPQDHNRVPLLNFCLFVAYSFTFLSELPWRKQHIILTLKPSTVNRAFGIIGETGGHPGKTAGSGQLVTNPLLSQLRDNLRKQTR